MTNSAHQQIITLILITFFLSTCTIPDKEISLSEDVTQYVNPFIGTGGEGHTYPGATVPFGMVQLSPDTELPPYRGGFPYCAGYQYGDSSIVGFSHTHFSGTGHSDMGDILLIPTNGVLQLLPGSKDQPDEGYRSRFSHDEEGAEPGYYWVNLLDYNIKAELTTSTRAGMHKYTFNRSDSSRILLDLVHSIYFYPDKNLWSQIRVENDTLVTGYRQTKGWAANRHIYFAIRFSKPMKTYGLKDYAPLEYRGFGKRASTLLNYPELAGKQLKGWFDFDINPGEEVLVKVGISGVDIEGALKNLDQEIPDWNFNRVRNEALHQWNQALSKVAIEGPAKEKEIFYSSLYHLMLTPVVYQDIDGRYRGADQAIHQADGFTNYSIFSLWDTYRATHPMFTILEPERVGDMITSMVKHSEQNVHKILPVWSFHANETWCMIGYHSVSVIADAWLKGIRNFDTQAAFDAMIASSTYAPYAGLGSYMKYGYVPTDFEHEGASKTLEYGYDDWCIAQMARGLGRDDLYKTYAGRSKGFEKIFDPVSGFMRSKSSDGIFREPFDPLYAQYGGDYTEGNAWQYSWYVPQDPARLIELLGGEEAFVKRLDTLFEIETSEEQFKNVEDIAGLIGQYAHGNEPSQHIAYLYNYAGSAWKTQEKIHRIMNHLFDNTPYGICGNEDCGQMSAWYLFSSMGFYPVCPGSLEYVIGTPKLPFVQINLGDNKKFIIEATHLSDNNFYIQSVTLNGQPLEKSYLRHEQIMNGGRLVFNMGPEPNKEWASGLDARPYSMTNDE